MSCRQKVGQMSSLQEQFKSHETDRPNKVGSIDYTTKVKEHEGVSHLGQIQFHPLVFIH